MRTLILTMLFSVVFAMPAAAQDTQAKTEGKAAGESKEKPGEKWTVLFNGKNMEGWKLPKGFDFDDAGKVDVKDGNLVLHGGLYATGIRWTGKFPKTNYEVRLEAQRADGYDFFVGLSFPVGDQALTLILGGWGGYLTGLSCIDGFRADENQTCNSVEFKNKQWYRVRLCVTDKRVVAYVDDKEICDLEIGNHKLSVTFEMEPCLPFGTATWGGTTGVLRNIRYRKLTAEEIKALEEE